MCPKKEILSAYLDEEISSPWDQKIKAHLAKCKICQRKLRELKRISQFLQTEKVKGLQAAKLRVKERLKTRLRQELKQEKLIEYVIPFWKRQIAVPMPVFAAGFVCLLVLLASLFFFLGKNQSELLHARSELKSLKNVQVYLPVQNPEQLLYFMQNYTNNYRDILIELPETDSFEIVGEPVVIYEEKGVR